MNGKFNPDWFSRLEFWIIKCFMLILLLDALYKVVKQHVGF